MNSSRYHRRWMAFLEVGLALGMTGTAQARFISDAGRGAMAPVVSIQRIPATENLLITVRVVDLETNAPIPNAKVTAWTANNVLLTVATDGDGRSFSLSVPAGSSLTVQASARNYTPANVPITDVRAPQNLLVQLAKFKPSVLSIRIFNGKIDQTLSSAQAVITSRKSGKSEKLPVSNGRIERNFTEADDVMVRVEAPGFKPASRQLAIELTPTGNRYEFDAVLEKIRFSVNVRAIDKETKELIPGIRFRLTQPGDVPPLIIEPDAATGVASASLPGLGTYMITTLASGYDDFTQSWVVEKEESDVLFQLKARPKPLALKEIEVKPSGPAAAPPVTASTPVKSTENPSVSSAAKQAPVVVPVTRKPEAVTVAAPVVSARVAPAVKSPVVAASEKPVVAPPVAVTPVAASSFGAVEKGAAIRLNNIYFDQSSPVLRPESHAELDQLYSLLVQNPSYRIEIRGHTDNQGDFNLNTKLSRDRCQAVIDYLVGKGIAKERLRGVGRGPIDAVAPNNNEENRRKNRRVEFVIL